MVKKIILLSFGLLLLAGASNAQKISWKKQRKMADDLMEEGKLLEAAINYEKAWQKKQKNKELIFKAGEAYYLLKDYRQAAAAFQHVKGENKDFPLVGLKYARSLKQDGQYDKAIKAFEDFGENYTGSGKAILEDILQTEIKGANLGKTMAQTPDRSINLVHLGNGVNTEEDEFAPFPAGMNQLYLSSTMGGTSRLYATTKSGTTWQKALIPSEFPLIQNGQYGNSALSPDGERLFFTICSAESAPLDFNSRCEIFVIKKEGQNWSQPQRLPDHINSSDATATQPNVVQQGGQEILYFSSNRNGGRGGLDIWYSTRDLGADDLRFSEPVNLGPAVNTLGDEITPFFDGNEGKLYFASNGLASIGGYDVFSAMGGESTWTVPQNLGFPLNSSADDFYYIHTADKMNGFLVSNRVFGGGKNNTHHTDIFEFGVGGQRIVLKGNVYDQASGQLLPTINVSLFQMYDDGTESLLVEKPFYSGSYLFEVLADRSFRVEIKSSGFANTTYSFRTDDPNTSTYGKPVFLEIDSREEPALVNFDPPVNTSPKSTIPKRGEDEFGTGDLSPKNDPGTTDAGVIYTSRGTSSRDNLEYATAAPKHSGIYYKVQLAAVNKSKTGSSKYQKAKSIGRIDKEELLSKGLVRMLVADFFSENDAISAMESLREMGFDRAYVVKYQDGERYGRVNLK